MIKILWNVQNPGYKEKFVVEGIGITLDATNLDKHEFKMSDMGDWPNFLTLLRYLKTDLQDQVTKKS